MARQDTKVEALEAQVAAMRSDLESVLARLATLESYNPQLMQERKVAERKAYTARLQALGPEAYAKLGDNDRTEWLKLKTDEQLVEMLRDAKPKLRDDVFARLSSWQRRAAVTFGLAPAPQLVEVAAHATFSTKYFAARKGDSFVSDVDKWREQCEREPRMAEWLADGSLTEHALSDDEARKHALNKYVSAWIDKQGLPGAVGPELPQLD